MKTKIKTLLAIFALGFIGIININAIAAGKRSANTEVTAANDEMLAIKTWMNDKSLYYSAEEFSAKDVDKEIEKYATEQALIEKEANLATESWINGKDLIYSAEEFTAKDVNNEIDEYATSQILPEEKAVAKSDFLTTAENYTAAGTAEEIAKYAQKLASLEKSRIGK